MPQLDKFTFFPVVSWVLIIIIILYNVLVGSGLIRLYKILLYRKKKLEYYARLRENLAEEHYYLLQTNLKFLIDFMSMIEHNIILSLDSIEGLFNIFYNTYEKDMYFIENWYVQEILDYNEKGRIMHNQISEDVYVIGLFSNFLETDVKNNNN